MCPVNVGQKMNRVTEIVGNKSKQLFSVRVLFRYFKTNIWRAYVPFEQKSEIFVAENYNCVDEINKVFSDNCTVICTRSIFINRLNCLYYHQDGFKDPWWLLQILYFPKFVHFYHRCVFHTVQRRKCNNHDCCSSFYYYQRFYNQMAKLKCQIKCWNKIQILENFPSCIRSKLLKKIHHFLFVHILALTTF